MCLVAVLRFQERHPSSGVHSHSQLQPPQRRAICEPLSIPCRGGAARPSPWSFRPPFVGRSSALEREGGRGEGGRRTRFASLKPNDLRLWVSKWPNLWFWPDGLEGPCAGMCATLHDPTCRTNFAHCKIGIELLRFHKTSNARRALSTSAASLLISRRTREPRSSVRASRRSVISTSSCTASKGVRSPMKYHTPTASLKFQKVFLKIFGESR